MQGIDGRDATENRPPSDEPIRRPDVQDASSLPSAGGSDQGYFVPQLETASGYEPAAPKWGFEPRSTVSLASLLQRKPPPVDLESIYERIGILGENVDEVRARFPIATANMIQFLLNEDDVILIGDARVAETGEVNAAQDENNERFVTESLNAHRSEIEKLKAGETFVIKDRWDVRTDGGRRNLDLAYAFGSFVTNSHARIEVTRTQKGYDVAAEVSHLTVDYYDWQGDTKLGAEFRLKDGRVIPLKDRELHALANAGQASSFHFAVLEEQTIEAKVAFAIPVPHPSEPWRAAFDAGFVVTGRGIEITDKTIVTDPKEVIGRTRVAIEDNTGGSSDREIPSLPENFTVKSYHDLDDEGLGQSMI
ncbi:hypothetical protein [Jannaschia sp. LMIT008]|uniref:hypothetical protein n=1 Tax=Jannaschia maritima TaxID=3032585 RepID=UPI002811A950|nr:hypothetical protein [Jannaschia sp. LMIT008]